MTTITAPDTVDLTESYELALTAEGVNPAVIMSVTRIARPEQHATFEQLTGAYTRAMREMGLVERIIASVTVTVTDAAVNHLDD